MVLGSVSSRHPKRGEFLTFLFIDYGDVIVIVIELRIAFHRDREVLCSGFRTGEEAYPVFQVLRTPRLPINRGSSPLSDSLPLCRSRNSPKSHWVPSVTGQIWY
jgi:hypothetical protein